MHEILANIGVVFESWPAGNNPVPITGIQHIGKGPIVNIRRVKVVDRPLREILWGNPISGPITVFSWRSLFHFIYKQIR